jgi:hypothetical protein
MEKTERNPEAENNFFRPVLLAMAAAAICAMILVSFWRASPHNEAATPYAFDSDAHKDLSSASPAYWQTEVDEYEYATLADMAQYDSTLRPAIRAAMADHRVSYAEWNAIIDLNDARWDAYNAARLETAKAEVLNSTR